MHCPFCGADDTKVIDSRLVAEGDSVRRRRECQTCGERFTTFETAELVMPRVVKSDGTREPFNEEKLRRGLTRALEKRPVGIDEIESALNEIRLRVGQAQFDVQTRVLVEERRQGRHDVELRKGAGRGHPQRPCDVRSALS